MIGKEETWSSWTTKAMGCYTQEDSWLVCEQ